MTHDTLLSAATSRPTRPTAPPAAGQHGLTAHDFTRIAAALEAELAATTRTAYASAWRQWERWCQARELPPLPAAPQAVAAFLVERAETGLTYGSIEMAFSAITHAHQREGLPAPATDITLRRVRRGLRRMLGTSPRNPAHPLTPAEIGQIVNTINPSTTSGTRDRALILLGYAAALRPSELAALALDDLQHRLDGLLITVRRSKTDQEGRSHVVAVVPGRHQHTDPLTALTTWLATRPTGPGPLFTRIHGGADLSPITPRTVSRVVQTRANTAGLDHLPVRGQSLRAGHATTAAWNGAPIDRIAAQTRHRDIDTLIARYIRPADALATSTSRNLGL